MGSIPLRVRVHDSVLTSQPLPGVRAVVHTRRTDVRRVVSTATIIATGWRAKGVRTPRGGGRGSGPSPVDGGLGSGATSTRPRP